MDEGVWFMCEGVRLVRVLLTSRHTITHILNCSLRHAPSSPWQHKLRSNLSDHILYIQVCNSTAMVEDTMHGHNYIEK